jgi:hypothetical protein
MLAELRERDATGEIAAIYAEIRQPGGCVNRLGVGRAVRKAGEKCQLAGPGGPESIRKCRISWAS